MKRKYIYTLATLALVIGVFSMSFGYLKDIKESTDNTTINLANFDVKFADGKDVGEVTFPDKTYPMSDTEGLNNPKITFGIINSGSIAASYKVSLIDGKVPSTMSNKDAKYQLKKGVNGETPTVVGIFSLSDDGLIDEGTMNSGDTIDYELIMWIDYDANPNGLTFTKYVSVEGMQIPNLDTSGANFPELADNMIPVYYDETNAVWKKADPTNGLDPETNKPVTTENYPYQWFNYDNQMWANAITVKESGTQTRDYYLNADLGTTIDMNDITTMWVWIPRYKYVIFNGNNETAEEQMINVTFEHGRETTGTVRCHDDIQTLDNSDHSEICTDTTNGGIKNFKSTYTHPAFCFGIKNTDGSCNGEELTGFWMAKFEMSTDDETCNTNQNEESCNKTGLNILVKPDVYSLRNINVSNIFANIRRMETYGNIHGFNQNSTATTWLDANSNLTGEINNDSNTIDTHMIKNMEWGAVAYLSQSKYGKQGNSLYEGDYKEIYINNNSDYKTGYSGGSYDSYASNVNTYLYNNLTSAGEGQGSLGTGASTTGTVYGIYDMSGGLYDSVMVNFLYFNYYNYNYIWTVVGEPQTKYYDKYSTYSGSFYEFTSQLRSKLGDGSKEVLKQVGVKYGSWNSDTSYFFTREYPITLRGGFISYSISDSSINTGIFSNQVTFGNVLPFSTSRPVLTVSRNMPWLNNN